MKDMFMLPKNQSINTYNLINNQIRKDLPLNLSLVFSKYVNKFVTGYEDKKWNEGKQSEIKRQIYLLRRERTNVLEKLKELKSQKKGTRITIREERRVEQKRFDEIINPLIENLEKCYWGQFYDILITKMDIENVKEDDYLFLVEYKTASYTTIMPLLMGSIFAGKKGEYLEQMKKFGKYLGIAFQIKDDILGVFGDIDKTGKSNLSDLKEGKKTLLVIKAYEKSKKQEKDFLKEKLGGRNLQEEDLIKFREIFEKTGALEYAEEKAREYIQKAKIVFEKIPFKEEWKDFLNDLMNYIIEREK